MADFLPPVSNPEPLKLQEKQIGSEGLKKRIIKQGIGWQTPFTGYEVEVRCKGKVKDGPFLDPAGDEETPLKFKLGQCEVIRGLDEGVATMRKGEKAIFNIPPNLAYGEAGFGSLIPPNPTLIFDVEMVSWTAIRDVAGDGGVMKRMVKDGHGWATPRDGDDVSVRYEARLEDGTLVSKSEQGCCKFSVGDGSLCPAIHIAVKTMRVSEKAELAARFSYGSGLCGNGKVGAHGASSRNPHVIILLELLSWNSVVDLIGDGTILKKILESGKGFDQPSEGSFVKVRYTGKHQNGIIFDQKGSDEEPFEFACLEEEVNEGLDRAIMSMRKGEKAQVMMNSRYVHENGDLKNASEDPKIVYEIQLFDFVKEEPVWKMETRHKIEKCKKKKQDGNALFKAGKFWRASMKYEKAQKYLEFNHSFDDEEKNLAKTLTTSCSLNNAACKLKLEQYHEVSRLCSKVLEVDPSNVKAFFRRAQAYLKTSELGKAEADIKGALSIDPNNREVKMEYKMLREMKKEHEIHEAKFFSTILAKMS